MRSTGNWRGKLPKKSFVLLKNEEHILPLEQLKKIAFIGPYVDNRNLFGGMVVYRRCKRCYERQEAVQGTVRFRKQYILPGITNVRGGCMSGRIWRTAAAILIHGSRRNICCRRRYRRQKRQICRSTFNREKTVYSRVKQPVTQISESLRYVKHCLIELRKSIKIL